MMGNNCSNAAEKNLYKQSGLAEVYAGKTKEFQDNVNFKEVQIVHDLSVLVAKISGKYYCIGSTCPHSGGPLGQGIYDDGRIYCPWHGSCFDFETGDIEEFPGVDCIPTYPAKSKNGKVFVYVNPAKIVMQIMKPMTKYSDPFTTTAIIGGGAAGYMCAQTLRQEGFTGVIRMFTKEKYLPYDRTQLSSVIDSKWKHVQLRSKDFYVENDIEVRLGAYVDYIDFLEHKIYVRGTTGYTSYDDIFIAVGNTPIESNTKGSNLKHIVTLHDLTDAKYIAAHVTGKRLLMVGSSFLAMELVTILKDKCKSIDILSRYKCPYQVILGMEIGSVILANFLKSSQ